MRRNAGAFVRRKIVRRSMLAMMGTGMAVGLAMGLVFYGVLPSWIGYDWGILPYAVAAGALLGGVYLMEWGPGWSLKNLEKGAAAEVRVGQAIETALMAENCAIAHSVTAIAKVGDIDHLVATPVAVWVIETKYRKVPRRTFPAVLGRIAANMEAVRRWAPGGTEVRGCLVLPYESSVRRRNYTSGSERITVYAGDSLGALGRAMQEEARKKRSLDEWVGREIRELARSGV